MAVRRRFGILAAALAGAALIAGCSSGSSPASSSPSSSSSAAAGGQIKIGVDLTYNNTAFWAAYINYETQ
jgi:ABC-type phosphate/phosphonate transport system substrate-binding protein